MKQVRFRKQARNTLQTRQNVETGINFSGLEVCYALGSVLFLKLPVQGMITYWVPIRRSKMVTHLFLRALAPVANATLDIVKIEVLRVIGHPCGKCWIT